MIELCRLQETDLTDLQRIMNYYIETGTAAFPRKILNLDMIHKMFLMIGDVPKFKGIDANGKMVGFCFLKPFHILDTFEKTMECTYFLDASETGKGFGIKMLEKLETEARQRGIKNLLACISSENKNSLKFHLNNGFEECGNFKNVGEKNGKKFGLIWMQKNI